MTAPGFGETVFIVASTDMKRVGIMLRRIQEQMKSLAGLQSSGTVQITSQALQGVTPSPVQTLEQQVEEVAIRVQEAILAGCGPAIECGRQENENANGNANFNGNRN
jgi:hypothetical protein